tara:strand:+ start:741 stop:2039 length:1299 start_codon:yes stop_codon:yes gene_type:complete
MFLDPTKLRRITVEITANCNSFCPQCLRRVSGDIPHLGLKEGDVNPAIKVGTAGNMPMETIKNIFTPVVMGGLKTLDLNGSFGDAINHPQMLDILHHIADESDKQEAVRKANGRNRRTDLWVSTNGAMRNKEFWTELGHLASTRFNPNNSELIFALDGTDDKTHQLYRRGCSYEKVLENARYFMEAGGKAIWQIIEFDHNKHQIDEAKRLAKELGFVRIDVRRSRWAERISNQLREKAIETGVVSVKEKETDFDHKGFGNVKKKKFENKSHKPPEDHYKSMEEKAKKIVVEKFDNSMDDYANNCNIWCSWGNEGKLQIEWDGRVHVCCHFTSYFARSWRKDVSNPDGTPNNTYHNNYVAKYDPYWNYTSHNKLEDVLGHRFYQKDLQDSWNNRTDDPEKPRLEICVDNCGSIVQELRNKKEDRISLDGGKTT